MKTSTAKSVESSPILDRYNDALNQIPAPGCGCHISLLSVSNMGTLAGFDGERIFKDIRRHIPQGNRYIPDKEILDAVNEALSDCGRGTLTLLPRPAPVVKDGKTALQRIIDQGLYVTEAELIKASPIPIPGEPQRHAKLLIETLYLHDDLLFIGEMYGEGIIGKTIKDAIDWLTFWIEDGKTSPHIIINPLTGLPAQKKSGDGETYRGDLNVKEYRYCLVEFDNLSRKDQIRFWSSAKLPIVALIDSGGKSIHAWLQVSRMTTVITAEAWQREIKSALYDRRLSPMGVDAACSNSARLSRLPGHYREEKTQYQRLLWLSREGRPVCK